MRARDPRLGRQLVVSGELDAPTRSRNGPEPPRHDGIVARDLGLEDPQLRAGIGLERAVAVEVIRLEIEQHRDAAVERADVLELERRELADDPRIGGRVTDEAREWAADVAGDLGRHPGGVEHGAEQRGRRRLAVRPGDADDRVREQAGPELDLGDDGNTELTRSHNGRRLGRDAGALHDELDAEEERVAPLTDEDLAVDPADVEIAPGVIADDVAATGVEGGGSRAAGARQADDENAARDWRHACKPRGRTHVRCATTIPPTINALPIAIGSVTFSPSTIAASANPETGCRNCSVAILAMPPRSRAQYQPI